jgi:hypothetical protein
MDITQLADFIYNKIEQHGEVRVRKEKIIARGYTIPLTGRL